jgi:hypothetical protein
MSKGAAALLGLAVAIAAFIYVGIYQLHSPPGNDLIVYRLNRWTGEVLPCVTQLEERAGMHA